LKNPADTIRMHQLARAIGGGRFHRATRVTSDVGLGLG
jgi:hypothetical protein